LFIFIHFVANLVRRTYELVLNPILHCEIMWFESKTFLQITAK